ncbi:MAG TPA: S8 family serine peptidase, partial [Micromonosporaceae bacterium]
TRDAVARAIAKDVVVVAAIGNEPEVPGWFYPAAYPGVVAAAGVDRNGNHAKFSVVSPFTVLAAPAVDIVAPDSREVGSGYSKVQGTSAATAIIAGAAALVRSRFPELSAAEVVHRLTATADDKGPPGRDNEYGYGVINIVRALTADVPPLQPSPTSTSAVATPPGGSSASGDETRNRPGPTVVIIGTLTLIGLLCAAFVAASVGRKRT